MELELTDEQAELVIDCLNMMHEEIETSINEHELPQPVERDANYKLSLIDETLNDFGYGRETS